MERHQFGILFVHGIGEQPEGDTLQAFGEPLVGWLGRWLSRAQGEGTRGQVVVENARLTPSRLGQAEPPHARLRLELQTDAGARSHSWLLAESWWGGEVQKPAFARLSGWMLTVGAWTILSHATRWAQNRKPPALRNAIEAGALLLWLPLALLLQLGVIALSLLALLPVPRLRGVLSNVLLTLTGVLGDSFVLVESDIQRAAIVDKTRDALRWLAERCERVVVVAHSQGGAVAHQALRLAQPENVILLVTLGSGLGKLEELIRGRRTSGSISGVAYLVPLIFLLAALIAYILSFEAFDSFAEFTTMVVGSLILAAVLFSLITARNHWESFGKWVGTLSLKPVRPGLTWLDVYASHDPVPNGALAPQGVAVDGLTSREIVNFRSWLRDHTSYWGNRCEFVPCVARAIAEAAGLGAFGADATQRFEQAANAHRRKLRWWSVTKWVTLAAVAAMFWRYGDSFQQRGAGLFERLQAWWFRADSTRGFLADVLLVVPPFLKSAFARFGPLLAGAAGPLLLIVLWRYGYRFLWRWWDNISAEQVFRPRYVDAWSGRIVDFVVIVFGFVPLLVVIAWPAIQQVQLKHALTAVFLGFYLGLLVLVIGRFARTSPELISQALYGRRDAWAELWEQGKGIVFIALLVGFFFVMVLPSLAEVKDVVVSGLIAIILGAALFRWHWRLLARVTALTPAAGARRLALAAPLAIVLAWAFYVVFRQPFAATMPSPKEVTDALLAGFMSVLGMYMLAMAASHGIVGLLEIRQRRRKSLKMVSSL